MTTIRQSLYVSYGGVNSSDLGIYNVNIDTGMLTEPFWGSRSIYKTKPRGKRRPFYHNVEGQPLTFTLQLAVQDAWDLDSLQQIKQWLRQEYYSPLIFSEIPDKIYFAICVNEPKLIHTGANTGYIEADFECNAPYAFSDYISVYEDLTSNPTSGTNITVVNNGDLEISPIIKFTKVGNGDITITNLSYSQDDFAVTGANDKQTIEVDCENEFVQSEMSATLSFTGTVNNGETITIGSRTYRFVTSGSASTGNVTVDVSGGTSITNAVNQLISAINNDIYSPVTAVSGTGTTSVIMTTKTTGNPNSNITLSETIANASLDITTLVNSYPDSLWNGNDIKLKVGTNILNVQGNCTMTITYRYILF